MPSSRDKNNSYDIKHDRRKKARQNKSALR